MVPIEDVLWPYVDVAITELRMFLDSTILILSEDPSPFCRIYCCCCWTNIEFHLCYNEGMAVSQSDT